MQSHLSTSQLSKLPRLFCWKAYSLYGVDLFAAQGAPASTPPRAP